MVEARDLSQGRPLAKRRSGLSAGNEVFEEENEHHHAEDDDERLGDAADQVGDHDAKSRRRPREAAGGGDSSAYFVKYQFSGLIVSSGFCGKTPWRLFWTSVSS